MPEGRCSRDAGMARSRDTSRKEAGMSPRSPEQLFLPAWMVRAGGASPAPTVLVRIWRARRERRPRPGRGRYKNLAGANRGPVGGSRRGGEHRQSFVRSEHRLKSVPLEKELDVV